MLGLCREMLCCATAIPSCLPAACLLCYISCSALLPSHLPPRPPANLGPLPHLDDGDEDGCCHQLHDAVAKFGHRHGQQEVDVISVLHNTVQGDEQGGRQSKTCSSRGSSRCRDEQLPANI